MRDTDVVDLMSDPTVSPITAIFNDPRIRACVQCGDCSGVCPVGYLMDFPPSRIIAAMRANCLDRVTAAETIWMCMACSACTAVCPAQIPVTLNIMSQIKEELLLSGSMPAELQSALENSQRYGNPLGESPRKRTDWNKGLSFPTPCFGKDTRQADVLWFVGDYPAYHQRVQPSTRAFAALLHLLKVDFATLGFEESSDGDSQRLAGERGLFEVLAEKNGKVMHKYQFNEIITTDPHAFNALKNWYPSLGISYPVRHSTQFLAEHLGQLRPYLTSEIKARVTYHDPCYLGRVNKIFDEPRQLLQAIPGITLVEMPHRLSNSLCCGGGGGGMWIDGFFWEKSHTRLSEWRVREALHCGADILAVACPYEVPRFEDALKTVPGAEALQVKDISDLLMAAIPQNQEEVVC
jgi:Fe-S oxidoreductase